jgi:tetratricopeptide (TPR) repeat protein
MKRVAPWALALVAATALAADDARTQAEQRIALVARMVGDSPTSQRIISSGLGAAVSHLDESKLHLARAQDAFKAGEYPSARRAAEEALVHLGHARRMVPDSPARQQTLRLRHEQQQAAIERLIEAWRERAGSAADAELVEAMGHVGSARQLGQSARYEEALKELSGAQAHLLTGMARLFASREVDYTPRATGPAEQFQLELSQYDAAAGLLPLAIAELKPRADAVALIDRYRTTATALRVQAQQQMARSENSSALASLRSAMQYVQRALAAAGVATPTPTGE